MEGLEQEHNRQQRAGGQHSNTNTHCAHKSSHSRFTTEPRLLIAFWLPASFNVEIITSARDDLIEHKKRIAILSLRPAAEDQWQLALIQVKVLQLDSMQICQFFFDVSVFHWCRIMQLLSIASQSREPRPMVCNSFSFKPWADMSICST